jgi:predicted kinase
LSIQVPEAEVPMLIVFAGLPGTGKTPITRELARQLEAVYLRIDSIEQTLRDSGAYNNLTDDAGYCVAYVIAEENLRLGRTVIADSVNPLEFTRDAWLKVAMRANVRAVEVELKCSNTEAHRRRVEGRVADIAGLRLPSWQNVMRREYHSWTRDHVVVDTACHSVADCVRMIRAALVERWVQH